MRPLQGRIALCDIYYYKYGTPQRTFSFGGRLMLFLQLTHNPELREGYVFEINFVVLLIAGKVNDATKISGEPG
ncbi:hypothetical protein ANRL3_01843 [Anaerolineae bacterium]|nr:hypothetical protein ANRL3_01843 [Anaerolineae bacterium]